MNIWQAAGYFCFFEWTCNRPGTRNSFAGSFD